MILEIYNNSNKGNVRSRNEDMILCGKDLIRNFSNVQYVDLSISKRFVVGVADGMGGHKSGDMASKIVCTRLVDFFYDMPQAMTPGCLEKELNNWVQRVHSDIIRMGRKIPDLYGMGTTLAALIFYENQIMWLNCGDSRIYRLRNNILTQLSSDHSLAALTGNSQISANIITNSIGAGTDVYLDIRPLTGRVYNGDIFLLCSDGLTDTFKDEIIEKKLMELSLDELISDAVNAGATDNVSASLIKICD